MKIARDNLQDEVNQDLPVSIQTLQEELKVLRFVFVLLLASDRICFVQTVEEQKDLLLTQFKELYEKKEKCDNEQHPLLKELKELKAQIEGYEEQRTKIAVCIYRFHLPCMTIKWDIIFRLRSKKPLLCV